MDAEQKSAQAQAAEWLTRMRNATPQEKAQFTEWILDSRRNLKEFLLAQVADDELRDFFRDQPQDVQAILAECREELRREAEQVTDRVRLSDIGHASSNRGNRGLTILAAAAVLIVALGIGYF